MPTYQVTSPDGRKLKITGDKPPSEAELNDIFSKVRQPQQPEQPQEEKGAFDFFTGDSKKTETINKLQEIGAAPELNEMSMPAFRASLGLLSTGEDKSLKNILSKQLGDKVSFSEDEKGNTIVNLPSGNYALNQPGFSGQDAIRGLFDILAFTPAGKAGTIAGATAKAGATEAAIEGTEAAVGGDFSPEDVALSAGLGGGFKLAENAIGAGYRAIKGDSSSSVVEAGKDAGIPVMTSDVMQPKTFAGKSAQQVGEKIPIAGTGAKREAQQEARKRATDELINNYGEFSYSAIVDSLKTQKNKLKNAAGNVLSSAGKKLDDVGEIPLDNTRAAIKAAQDELNKKGVISSSDAVTDLDTLIKTIDEAPQSFTTLKENRTAFRDIINGADKADRSQLTSRAKSLLERVGKAMTQDMESFAKQNLNAKEFIKWQRANKVYANEAQKMTKTRLKNVLDSGDITPENVKGMLFSQKPSEVNLLYKSLTPEGKANARAAIISKVVTDLSKRQSGVSPNTFASEMGKYGLQTGAFFKGQEKRALNGLLKALNATRRAQDAAVTTATGQQAVPVLAGGAIVADPLTTIVTGSTLGAISRSYESPVVRNLLLKLDSIPAHSTQFEKVLGELTSAMSIAAQTARE